MILSRLENFLIDNNVFLTGGAGVGKSFLTMELIRSYRVQGKIVIVLGSTALSAFNIGGVTLHSFFAFKRCQNYDELYYEDRKQKDKLEKLKRILKQCDLLVIDEISMVSALLMEMIYYRLTRSGFNGKILLAGDFFQLPPVIKYKENQNQNTLFQNTLYAFSSQAWNDLKFINLKLSITKRTLDKQFYEYLFFLRIGEVNKEMLNFFKKMLISSKNLLEYMDEYTLLCATNKKTNYINTEKLNLLQGKESIFNAKAEKLDFTLDDKTYEQWINGLNSLSGLKLKIGAKIIFCVNNKEENYYNGEQGVVLDFIKDKEQECILIEKNNGERLKLKPYEYTLEEYELDKDEKLEVKTKAKFVQFPIKLAYAITIHKSQGMSIDKLICDIDGIFEKGQLYVCLSRAINPSNLKIVYNYKMPFEDYFLKILKFDKEVKQFYLQEKFVNLE
ncbi:AAA family ATPase [Campylobacter lari]|uniref:AAA family ATPase n=1 Tax=Campylobacter lari TaxID=201 RepID=A0A698FY20_CAMLA|nr:DEAD/DEAH box helicase [Campylobacter lari]ECW8954065.1 AAA family ATPase [Campylobacter lari]MBT0793824.1 AAA family ATPase [Campylobacter lari]MCR6510302.1 DEAD/DEAH box helicase [Campylobacter lari]MCR6527450.1 DEAD/DEAH box helicase [Campylobacter lari]MCR6556940.1 DEAD/DEAH box helicase [Campylobacter lari]